MINSIEYENSENEDNIRQMFLIWAYWTLVCIFWIGFAIFATLTDLIYGAQEKTINHSNLYIYYPTGDAIMNYSQVVSFIVVDSILLLLYLYMLVKVNILNN